MASGAGAYGADASSTILAAADPEHAATYAVADESASEGGPVPDGDGSGDHRRRPWWVWSCSLPIMVAAAALYSLVFAAPQPAGWAHPNERRRLRLVAVGFAASVSTLAIDIFLLVPWAPIEQVRDTSYWHFARFLLLSAAALCIAYAILRHRVFDIHGLAATSVRPPVRRGTRSGALSRNEHFYVGTLRSVGVSEV